MRCYPCRGTGLTHLGSMCPHCDGAGVLLPIIQPAIPRQQLRCHVSGRFITARAVVDGGEVRATRRLPAPDTRAAPPLPAL